MKSSSRFVVGCLVLALVSLIVVGCGAPAPTPAPAPKPAPGPVPAPSPAPPPAPKPAELPKMLRMSTYDVGSTAYSFAAALCEAIEGKTGSKTRIIPAGTDVARLLLARARDADLVLTSAGGVGYFATHGYEDFAPVEWGPQAVYMVWLGGPTVSGLYVRADSNINTLSDLKGKKVPTVPGATAINMFVEACLSFAGLTMKDVTVVTVASYAKSLEGLVTGVVDTGMTNPWSANAIELQASPHGARVLPLPKDNTEGWKRLRQLIPYQLPILNDDGVGCSKEKPVWLGYYSYAIYSYPWVSDDVAYAIAKSLWESYDAYKGKHSQLVWWDQKHAIQDFDYVRGNACPYHPGAVKFFKEKGVWTDRHEVWQKEQMKLIEERKKAWDAATEAATKAGVKPFSADWPAFVKKYCGEWLDKIEVKESILR